MAFYASNIIKIASSQLGYAEKNNDSNLYGTEAGSGNHTKYAKELHDAGFFNGDKCGYDWCAVFVTWCAWKLTGSKEKAMSLLCQSGPYGAGCTQAKSYYLQSGRYDKNPRKGDQVIFNSASGSKCVHTGIVVAVTDSMITTVEGNTSNKVMKKTYKRADSTIDGFGHPRYDEEPEKQTFSLTMDYLKKGNSGKQVKALQKMLKAMGYYNSTVDGDFGNVTESALIKAQKQLGVTADGEAGKETWGAMLGVTE